MLQVEKASLCLLRRTLIKYKIDLRILTLLFAFSPHNFAFPLILKSPSGSVSQKIQSALRKKSSILMERLFSPADESNTGEFNFIRSRSPYLFTVQKLHCLKNT